MIASLQGTVKELAPQVVILEVSGVGFAVSVPDEHMFTLGQKLGLSTYFHWNQEQGPHLFGFTDPLAKFAFSMIISCSGIGPKIGLAVLAKLTPHDFFQAILLAETKTLSSINGIGTKKAESIILNLKDKVAKLDMPAVTSGQNNALAVFSQVSQALTSLSYSRPEITAALDYAKSHVAQDKHLFDELLRKALAFLAKRS